MKKFRSATTRLLQIARQQQRLCELLLARAQAADRAAARAVEMADEARADADRTTSNAIAGGERAVILQVLQFGIQRAEELCQQRRAERDQTAKKLSEALAALHTQQARTRSLERLEQRAFDEYRREMFHEQELMQDEQRVRRHWRQRQQERQVTHA